MSEVEDAANQNDVDVSQREKTYVPITKPRMVGPRSKALPTVPPPRYEANNVVLFPSRNPDALRENTNMVHPTDAPVRLNEPITSHQDIVGNTIDELAAEPSAIPQPSPAPVAEGERSIRRVNVNFSQSAYETLEQLAVAKGKTMSEVLREAIQIEKWLTDTQTQGWHVLLEKNGRVRELVQI